jgi:hypothetical protein
MTAPAERKINAERNGKMRFVLTGFTHDVGFRVFAFEGIGEDRARTKCTVRADMALVRIYGIHIQELPLLCRGLLDRLGEGDDMSSLTFSEDEMRVWATERTAAKEAAASRRKPPHRPAAENLGASWRGQPPSAIPNR